LLRFLIFTYFLLIPKEVALLAPPPLTNTFLVVSLEKKALFYLLQSFVEKPIALEDCTGEPFLGYQVRRLKQA
jgi:hypothetical protein